jgi:hypothetical protein
MLRMVAAILMIFLLMSVSCAQKDAHSVNEKSFREIDAEEYAVYCVLVDEFYMESDAFPETIVVLNRTHSSGTSLDWDFMREFGVIVDNSITKSRKEYRLKNLFKQKDACVLISGRQFGRLAWDGFYKKFPKSGGLISLSRVGFNPEKKLAFVSFCIYRGELAASGRSALLHKEGDEWRIKEDMIHSLS